jgi:hypothetical protein
LVSLSTFVLLAIGQGQGSLSPSDAIAAAHADLAKIAGDKTRLRYLSLYATPAKERERFIRVLNAHCNALSREPDLTPVAIVPGTQGSLVRIDLRDYRWDKATWEKLLDPYFTAMVETTVETPWEGGTWRDDGRYYPQGAFRYKKTVRSQALAPWLSDTAAAQKRLAEVVQWTGSKAPVVHAAWWFNQTAAAADRSPNYYDFLGVKDEATFQKAIGADVKRAEDLGAELREAVADSGVTLHPRAIVRLGTVTGSLWKTLDIGQVKGNKNPLRVLGREIDKEYDASEQFGHLPNGLWATGLFDRQGKVQASAPDNIASDGMSKSNDRRVHVNVSCIRCHANGGLQDLDGWVRNLLTPPLQLRSPDFDRVRELRRQYARKLEPFIEKDRAVFANAVREITGGWEPKEFAAAYAAEWERYEDAKIGLAEAAADLGVSVERWWKALDASVRSGSGDTVLSSMLLQNPRLNRVPVRVWEDSYGAAQLILKGHQQ